MDVKDIISLLRLILECFRTVYTIYKDRCKNSRPRPEKTERLF
jgi:hypothetical protein